MKNLDMSMSRVGWGIKHPPGWRSGLGSNSGVARHMRNYYIAMKDLLFSDFPEDGTEVGFDYMRRLRA